MKNRLRKIGLLSEFFSVPYQTKNSLPDQTNIVWRVDLLNRFEYEDCFSFISIECENKDLILEICIKEISEFYYQKSKQSKP